MAILATIQELSSTGQHQKCLQACKSALQANPEETYAHKYAGKSLIALGEVVEAKQYLAKAHQLDKNDPETVKELGNIAMKLNETNDAEDWYKKALDINNAYAPAYNNLGRIRMLSGNNKEAINLYNKAIKIDPKLVEAYIGAATTHLAIGNINESIECAKKGILINKRAKGLNELLGIIFQSQSCNQKAIQHYKMEIRNNSQANNSFQNIGLIYLNQNEPIKALEQLRHSYHIFPSEQCAILLAQTYQRLKQYKEAVIEYKKISINKSSDKLIPFNLGICLLETGEDEEALKAFRLASHIDKTFVEAWGSQGITLKKQGLYHEAIDALEKVLELDTNNFVALTNLGVIYRQINDLEKALALTLKAIEYKPENPNTYIDLGLIYKDLGNMEEALFSTIKSVELEPKNATAHMNLGGIYKEIGQLDQALAETLKSIQIKDDNANVHLNIGEIYKDLGQLDKALASTLKSLELKADNPKTHINLAAIYKDLGQLDRARESMLKTLELEPDNPYAQINMAAICQDLGDLDEALIYYRNALKDERTSEPAAVGSAIIYQLKGEYQNGVMMLTKTHSKKANNLLLSLYLCLNNKIAFNKCAAKLIADQKLNQRGIAAIDHANVLYSQKLYNGLNESTLNSIQIQSINRQEFSDEMMQSMLTYLRSEKHQSRNQLLLANGLQTSGNILNLPIVEFKILKDLLVKKIDNYNTSLKTNTDNKFRENWENNMYTINGWAIIMNRGGNLKPHNHETGWLTGTFYLQMPEESSNIEEGAIEFSHQGPQYPQGSAEFKRKVIRPRARDLNIFSSSVFHRTMPFQSATQRICVAFDVQANEK